MNKKILPWLITICALGLGGTAAYYSIIGLSKLFAGVATAVIIMASFLEASKLTLATLLHSYWNDLSKLIKIYYIISLIILSLLTSVGIYGMLSSGYQDTANKLSNIDSQVALVETKRDNIKEQLISYNSEKSNINEAVNNLRSGLSNNIIQYKDKETGQIITTTSSSNRKALEKQLEQTSIRQNIINSKIDELNTKLFEYENQIVEIKNSNDLANEIGPLKYLSTLTNTPMDKVINILLLIIIFVFDPLAISLVVAANYAFEKSSTKYKENFYGDVLPLKNKDENLSDWDATLNDGLDNIDEEEEDDDLDYSLPNENLKEAADKYKTLTQKEQDLLKSNSISSWRKNKIKKKLDLDSNDDLTKTY